MSCPFPGMDPYLEHPGWWPDFHADFIPTCRAALIDKVPDHYDVRIETLSQFVELSLAEIKLIEPDLYVATKLRGRSKRSLRSRSTASLEQATLRVPKYKEVRHRWINVFHRPTEALVTVIEVLSPSNKSGNGLIQYQVKRDHLLDQRVHLVEINLLAGGQRPEIASAWPAGDYYALIARAEERPRAGIVAWSVRDSLPTIPIPLRAPDPDVPLDLASAFETTYNRARYARVVAYTVPPIAPLARTDRAWAAKRGAAFARRK